MPPGNVTGFDKAKFVASTGQPANDPWARHEAWRSTGPFTRAKRFKGALPGLAWGTGAFVIYLAAEAAFGKKEEHHAEGHGEKESH